MIQFSAFSDLQSLRRAVAVEAGMTQAQEAFMRAQTTVDAYCHICARRGLLTVNVGPDFGPGFPNLREGLVCVCGAKNRDRLMMLASRSAIERSRSVAFFGALSGWARWARAAYPDRIRFCEYFPRDVAFGAAVSIEDFEVQNEDLTQMTFASASVDLVLHQDVLEHIPDYRAALADTLRILRPGGETIFTAPFFHLPDRTFVRAAVEPDGSITHFAPPELHGDPLVPEGILAFYNFGWSLIEDLREVGFVEARVEMLYRPDLGIVSTGCPIPEANMMPVVIRATKPSGSSCTALDRPSGSD